MKKLILVLQVFWLIFGLILTYLLFHYFQSLFFYDTTPLSLQAIRILIVICIPLLLIFFYRNSRIQNIHNSPSWVPYSLQISLFTVIYVIFLSPNNYLIGFLFLIPSVLALINTPSNKDLKQKRFAAGSISKTKDQLGIRHAAESTAESIWKQNKPLKIYILNGDQGWGKSSFARMIVESLGSNTEKATPKETLYTYIALTETNEENDLGRLFEERWIETLANRYPIIKSHNIEALSTITRSEESFMKNILGYLTFFNTPLFPTYGFCSTSAPLRDNGVK